MIAPNSETTAESAEETAAREATVEALRPWFDAMCDQRTVWALETRLGDDEPTWMEVAVTEIRRPSPYGVRYGTVCVRPRVVDRSGVTYIFRPDSDRLSLTDPTGDPEAAPAG